MVDLAARTMALRPGVAAASARSLLPPLLGIAFAAVMHYAVAPTIGPYHAKLMMDIGINIVLAVSLTMVNGFTGQFSIGHAGFMAVGGYVSAAIVYYGSYRLWGSAVVYGHPILGVGAALFVASLLVGGTVAAVLGYIVGLPSLRLRGDYLAIVTLGFGEIVRVVFMQTGNVIYDADAVAQTPWWKLPTYLGGALGFTGLPYYTSNFWVYLVVAITLLAAFRLKESSYGRAFLAIRENEVAAEAMGVPTTKYKVLAFVLAAFFAGMAGGLYAHEVGSVNARELGFQKSFDLLIMVVLGGMGSISGSVLATIVLTLLPEWLRGLDEYRMIIYAALLITMMLVRPQGLFGLREVWDLVPLRLRRFREPDTAPLENPDPRLQPTQKELK